MMDTSKEYIEMCRKAVEIREAWEPKVGDWTDKGVITNIMNQDSIIVHEGGHFPEYGLDELTWTPHQDQLQGMFASEEGTIEEPIQQARRFAFQLTTDKDYYNQFSKSHEQLWLAFVMYEKFNKKWDGKEWN